MCVLWWRDGAMEWNTCFNKVQNWDKNANWKKIYKSFLVESPLIKLLLIKWRLSVLRAAPGAFPPSLEWTWVKRLNVYDFLGYVQPSSVHSSTVSTSCLSVSLKREHLSPLPHHIKFPSAPSTNCEHSLNYCLRLWSLWPQWLMGAAVLLMCPCPSRLPGAFWLSGGSLGGFLRVTEPDQARVARFGSGSLTNTRLGKLSRLLAICSAQLSAVCMPAVMEDKMVLSGK